MPVRDSQTTPQINGVEPHFFNGNPIVRLHIIEIAKINGFDPIYFRFDPIYFVSMRLPVQLAGENLLLLRLGREALIRKGILTPYQGTRWDFIQKGRQ